MIVLKAEFFQLRGIPWLDSNVFAEFPEQKLVLVFSTKLDSNPVFVLKQQKQQKLKMKRSETLQRRVKATDGEHEPTLNVRLHVLRSRCWNRQKSLRYCRHGDEWSILKYVFKH